MTFDSNSNKLICTFVSDQYVQQLTTSLISDSICLRKWQQIMTTILGPCGRKIWNMAFWKVTPCSLVNTKQVFPNASIWYLTGQHGHYFNWQLSLVT